MDLGVIDFWLSHSNHLLIPRSFGGWYRWYRRKDPCDLTRDVVFGSRSGGMKRHQGRWSQRALSPHIRTIAGGYMRSLIFKRESVRITKTPIIESEAELDVRGFS